MNNQSSQKKEATIHVRDMSLQDVVSYANLLGEKSVLLDVYCTVFWQDFYFSIDILDNVRIY